MDEAFSQFEHRFGMQMDVAALLGLGRCLTQGFDAGIRRACGQRRHA